MNLTDMHVLLTGGASGLGRAMLSMLLQRGARVSVFDIDEPGLANAKNDHPDLRTILCDVADEGAVGRQVEMLVEEAGAPDVLVNNAGVLHSAPLIRITAAGVESHSVPEWQRVISLNLTSVFLMTRAVVPYMVRARKRGVVVNISSVSAAGNAGQTAYSAAKAGVNAMTAVWARELGPLGIRVAAVAPGFSDTSSTRQATSDAVLSEVVKRVPLRRLAKPEEIALGVISAIENDFFSGKVLELDGGLVL